MTLKLPARHSLDMQIAFDRLAHQKGWVKEPVSLTKKASLQTNLQPSDDLSENLIKLCQALRTNGLSTQASEIEQNFLLMKTAEVHLYRVHDEDGEDVINFAHPDGSKKLDKSWDELGEVETITDRQRKIREIAEKPATGKLSSKAAAALIKIKTADANDDVETALGQIGDLLDQIDNIVKDRGGLSVRLPQYLLFLHDAKMALTWRPFTTDNIGDLASMINRISGWISPGLTGGVSNDAWSIIKPLFHRMNASFKTLRTAVKASLQEEREKILGAPTSPTSNAPTTSLSDDEAKISTLIGKLTELKMRPATAANKRLMDWIDAELKALNDFAQMVRTSPAATDAADIKQHEDAVNAVLAKVG